MAPVAEGVSVDQVTIGLGYTAVTTTQKVKAILLGPSTPMLPEAFTHLPVYMLAGTAITDPEKALAIVRHGGGARTLRPVSRKVYRLTRPDRSM